MEKRKQRGQTRRLRQIMNGDAIPRRVGTDFIAFTFPSAPDVQHLFTRSAHPDFIGLLAPEGLVLRCRGGCRKDHILFWDDSDFTRAQMLIRQPDGPAFYNILCIDGRRVQIAMPGERFEGKVTTLLHITDKNAFDGFSRGVYDSKQ